MANIQPYFYDRITINYGDDIVDDPFRTTHVAAYRADYRTTNEFVKNNRLDEDIIINVMTLTNYFYLGGKNDYVLNQNYRWTSKSVLNEELNYMSIETESILLNSPYDIEKIIRKNKDRRIWIIVNGGSINILSTTHVRQDFIKFLEQNKDHVVYWSPDGISRVLLFNN